MALVAGYIANPVCVWLALGTSVGCRPSALQIAFRRRKVSCLGVVSAGSLWSVARTLRSSLAGFLAVVVARCGFETAEELPRLDARTDAYEVRPLECGPVLGVFGMPPRSALREVGRWEAPRRRQKQQSDVSVDV